MAQNSKIEWTHHTANLWHGCTKVHEGCDNCYAETLSKRWGNDIWGPDKPRKEIKSFFNDLDKFQKLAAAAGEVHRVFVGSMMDIFEKEMDLVDSKGNPTVYSTTGTIRQKFFGKVKTYPNLMFLLLTKRPSNINKYIPESWKQNPPSNVMFGTSVVNQATADKLIPQLLEVKGKKFLSMEPLLGPVDMKRWLPKGRKAIKPDGTDFIAPHYFMSKCEACGWIGSSEMWIGGGQIADTGDYGDCFCPNCEKIIDCELESKIDWVIVGGESGHHARPMHPDWVRSLRSQCEEADVPFLFKQWGEWVSEFHPKAKGPNKHKHSDAFVTPNDNGLDYRGQYMVHVGKKEAGNELDGKQHLEFPKH